MLLCQKRALQFHPNLLMVKIFFFNIFILIQYRVNQTPFSSKVNSKLCTIRCIFYFRRRPPPPPPPKSDTASTSTNVEDKDVTTENLTAVPSRSISQSTIRSDVATLKRTNTVAARAMSTIGVASRHKMTVSASPPRESFLEANVPHQREELLEADIMLQMKIAEDTRASLKLMEKRISKYFQTMESNTSLSTFTYISSSNTSLLHLHSYTFTNMSTFTYIESLSLLQLH
jgi:hypothetical protein